METLAVMFNLVLDLLRVWLPWLGGIIVIVGLVIVVRNLWPEVRPYIQDGLDQMRR